MVKLLHISVIFLAAKFLSVAQNNFKIKLIEPFELIELI